MSFFSDVERDLVVSGRTELAEGVLAIDLVSPNGRDLPAWTPGSHIDVMLPARPGVGPLGPGAASAGPGGEPLERQYSLCGDGDDRSTWRVAVLREDAGRGGSVGLHERIEVGGRLRVRGPRNHFPFTPAAGARYLFVAGGIGITPLRSMVAAAEASGADWTLDYAGRSRASMAFVDELTALYPTRVRVHAADEGARLDVAALAGSIGSAGSVGSVGAAGSAGSAGSADAAGTAGVDAAVYACGPARLLEALEAAFCGAPDVLHLERFEAKEFGDPVWTEPFEVELAMTGTVVTVDPDTSVLDAIRAQSPETPVLSSCRRGTCGTCEAPVLEGEIEHRDSILTPLEREESAVMMVCVSRAACPRIVLDL
ncbi:MAG: oxidoreductase [Microbacterium sp.]|uniref:PDR/VanB family oxidoreductase n=1 Tax=Microbacterium sp. TaxID=51671 RepID=UPI000DAF7E1C|nr:PDR/VanB family oxidoreductase [Microbacterium sp.]PZU40370.1 MAG: oxidoreductase [Microbacterium sp.]